MIRDNDTRDIPFGVIRSDARSSTLRELLTEYIDCNPSVMVKDTIGKDKVARANADELRESILALLS